MVAHLSSPRSRALLTGVLAGVLASALVVWLVGREGGGRHPSSAPARPARVTAHTSSDPSAVRGARTRGAPVALVPDPEAPRSFPESPQGPAHALAQAPERAAISSVAPGAPSDAEVRQELTQMQAALRAQHARVATARGGGALDAQGAAHAPAGAPSAIRRVIAGANAIAGFPYRFGGGHGSFIDDAYDCSGSLSYALAAGGMVSSPLTSGDFMRWGVPGPGRWITVLANEGHTYMLVAGLRYDTSGRDGPLGSRWQAAGRSSAGFVVRHWPGL